MSKPFRTTASRFVVATILCCSIWACPARAQAGAKSTESAAPVPLEPAPPVSPQLQRDGTVLFQVSMPNAAKVELHLEGMKDPLPMMKSADGMWSLAVPGLAPQYYSYSFNVDGIHVLDPHNVTLKPSFFNVDNVFLVPGHPPMPWETADVPHGVVHHHFYRSNIVGINSEYYVYTPPNFDSGNKQEYPVLYLLHGYSDDPSAWTQMGNANVILDNLIAQGKVKPMIVVMPLGYGTMEVITRGWHTWNDPKLVQRNYSGFSDALFQEVMPLVKKQYPLSEKREDHAIAGLSMGGAESLQVGLNHLDDFAYVGGFSSAPLGVGEHSDFTVRFPGINTRSAQTINARLRVLWIACGTEDGLFDPNQKFIAWLKQQGLQPTAIQTPGRHVWMLWRENLSRFAALLFQSK
jgi:enterochelin esterase-like enzyme